MALFGKKLAEKQISIEGMSCKHCAAHVKEALEKLPGVNAAVDLEHKLARVTLKREVSDDALTEAITGAGYKVIGIK